MADDSSTRDLSEKERELLSDYFSQTTDKFRPSVTEVLTKGEVIKSKTGNFEDALQYVSDSVSATEVQLFTLNRMKTEVLQKYDEFTPAVQDVPTDAQITPEEINRLIVRRDVSFYFQLVGSLIEKFSIELIMKEVIEEDRQSESVRSEIENMSQSERMWWLYVTGAIDNGSKSELGRAYSKRNSLAHDLQTDNLLREFQDIESDIKRAYNAVNGIHERVYDITIEMKLSNLLIDD